MQSTALTGVIGNAVG